MTTNDRGAPEDRLEGALLVRRVAGGDHGAVSELFDRYSPSLLAQIVSMLGDRAEAEDVLQEVFLQMWRQAGRYDHQRASVLTWLSMVARTRAI
ncbi:MAG TPA: sigma factor, partial [Thermoanaerobaculia bacterium]|nr:sigma factor [Thermoanaerobaculia bacterium]